MVMCSEVKIVFISLLSIGIVYTSSLTCKDVMDLGMKKIKLYELQSLSVQDVKDCLPYLGKEKLTLSEATFIWHSIVEFYSGIPNIPEDTLVMLHWVTIAIQPDDYQNMTLSTLDVISNFGFDYGLSDEQLGAIADRVRWDFGDKQPEDYSCYDLTAMRQILCAFNKSEIERIHPRAYKEVAVLIGKLRNCNKDVMQGFATLAVDSSAFGSPDTWTNSTIRSLGVVAEHFPVEITVKLKEKLGNYTRTLENTPNTG